MDPRQDRIRRCLRAAARSLGIGDLSQAGRQFQQAQVSASASGRARDEAQALLGLGEIARLQGDSNTAGHRYTKAHALNKIINDPEIEARSLLGLGDVAQLTNNHRAATRHYTRALDLSQAMSQPEIEARALLGLGNIARLEGNADIAQDRYAQAQTLGKAISRPEIEACALLGLGNIAKLRGDSKTAVERYTEAHTLGNSMGNPVIKARCLLGLGRVAQLMDDHTTATGHFTDALELTRNSSKPEIEALCLLHLGEVARLRKDHPSAAGRYTHALTLSRVISQPEIEARSLLGLGDTARLRQDSQTAESQYVAARTLARHIDNPEIEARSLLGLGDTARVGGQHAAASQHFREAARLLSSIGMNDGVSVAAQGLVLTEAAAGQADKALQAALMGIRAVGKLRGTQPSIAGDRFWNAEFRGLFDAAAVLAAEAQNPQAGLLAIQAAKDLVVAGLLRISDAAPSEISPEIAEALARVEEARRALTSIGTTASCTEGTSNGAQTAGWIASRRTQLNAAIESLEQLAGDFAHRYAPLQPAAEEEVLGAIPEGIHTLAYHLATRSLGDQQERILVRIWVSPDRDCEISTALITPEAWSELFAPFSPLPRRDRLLIAGKSSDRRRDLEELSELLLPGRFQQHLACTHGPDEPARVLVLPTQALWYLPYAALIVENKPLAYWAASSLAPSLSALPDSPYVPASHHGVLAYLDPGLKDKVPFNQTLLGRLFGPCHIATTPEQLRAALREADSYRLAVITAHGVLQSGLAHALRLTDGTDLITAGDLLASRLPPHLTLCACESLGRADDECPDPISLATVAFTRGCQSITASLWLIPASRTTSRFQEQFYTHLAQCSAAEALRRAQMDLMASHPDADLWEWAGHAAIGIP